MTKNAKDHDKCAIGKVRPGDTYFKRWAHALPTEGRDCIVTKQTAEVTVKA